MKGYQKNSAEARLGALGERWVDAWCSREGGCRLDISKLGKDALITTPDGRLVSPDRLGVIPGEGTYFYDIKTKAGAVRYELKQGALRQGIDLPHWSAYCAVSEHFGIPGALALVELRRDRAVDILDPHLLWGRLADLAMSVQIWTRPTNEFRHGGAWWDVGRFVDKGPLPVDELAIPVTPLALHSWERPDAPAAQPTKASAPTAGCMLMLPLPGGGHRMCGKPLHDLVFCKEHA